MEPALRMFCSAAMVALSLLSRSTDDRVRLTIVDRVAFTVPGNWAALITKSDAEKTVFAFQIPNPADEGTPDSTNVVVVSSHLANDDERAAFQKTANMPKDGPSQRSLTEGWQCWNFSAKQDKTPYQIWDCYRVINECGVHVRDSWPELPKNPSDFDQSMEVVLSELLQSFAPAQKIPSSK
jgi:hypothetical protein